MNETQTRLADSDDGSRSEGDSPHPLPPPRLVNPIHAVQVFQSQPALIIAHQARVLRANEAVIQYQNVGVRTPNRDRQISDSGPAPYPSAAIEHFHEDYGSHAMLSM